MVDILKVQKQGFVSVLELNRPDSRNALSHELVEAINNAFQEFDESDQRVAVLCGAGDHFSMGSDPALPVTELWRCMPTIGVDTEKPIISAVHGQCRGSAFSMVAFTDLTICSEDAEFCYPEGIHGATGGLVASLACRIPHRYAMEIMLMGRVVSGRRAFEMGLANAVVPNGRQIETAVEWAETIATRAPLVMSLLKRFVGQTIPKGPSEIQASTIKELTAVRSSADSSEGKLAMAEGRSPVFSGH